MIQTDTIIPQTCGAYKELEIVHDYLYGEDDEYKMFLYLKHQALLETTSEYDYKSVIEYLQEVEADMPGHDWGNDLRSIAAIIEEMEDDGIVFDDEGRAHFSEDLPEGVVV